MNPSAPSFKPAGSLPAPSTGDTGTTGTTAADASLVPVVPRERQAGVADHRVTPDALARLDAANVVVPNDHMSVTSAVDSNDAMPHGPTFNLGMSQHNSQQNVFIFPDRRAGSCSRSSSRRDYS